MLSRDRARAITVSTLAGVLAVVTATSANAGESYRGTILRTSVTLAPNARCGAAPDFVEATTTNIGNDTLGGPFTLTAKYCVDTKNGEFFDGIAVATYSKIKATMTALVDTFHDVVDATVCTVQPDRPVGVTFTDGTGDLEGAEGRANIDYIYSDPACGGNGQVILYFDGHVRVPKR